MRFSQDFIERVREANNLVEIISQHTELRRNGDRLMGRCPFRDHQEKTASFSVSESKQLYHCFGCKKSGNLYTFLETHEGMSFREAVEFLAKRASIPLPADESRKGGADGAVRDPRDTFLGVNKLASQYFHEQLKRLTLEHPAVTYIRSRGLNAEVLEKFKIGVALEAWEGLVTFLGQKKIPLPMAEDLGLVKRKKTPSHGSGFYDLFRERIMFPILSPSGEVLGFGGRTYGSGTPKYLNSPETAVFNKGRVLYGLHETGRFIRTEDRVIIVEGYMDALALYAAGIKNVVAILGTAFTAEHAKLISRYTSNVTVLLDGDEAGMNAAERCLPILLQAQLLVKGCFLPDGLDPDDFIRQRGVAALREEVERSPELFSLVLGRWMRHFRGSASEKVNLVEQLFPVLQLMENRPLRELYIAEAAQRLDVDIPWLNRTLVAAAKQTRPAAPKSSPPLTGGAAAGLPQARPIVGKPAPMGAEIGPGSAKRAMSDMRMPRFPVPATVGVRPPLAVPAEEKPVESIEIDPPRDLISLRGAPRDEAYVLSLALQNESHFEFLRDDTEFFTMLSHPGIRQAFGLALEKYGQKPEEFAKLAASLASQVDTPGVVTCALDLMRRPGMKTSDASSVEGGANETEERRFMAGCVNAIKKRYFDRELKRLANLMRAQSTSQPEMLEQFMNIQKARHALDKE